MSNVATNKILSLSKVVGYQSSVRGNVGFSNHNVLFYLSGQIGVYHDLKKTKPQKFVNLREDNWVTAIAFGLDNFLAAATKGKSPNISVFNLKTQEKVMLPKPEGLSR